MYRFVMNIPKDIIKNLNKTKTKQITNSFSKPKISLKDQLNINYLRFQFKYNNYKKKLLKY